MIPDDGKTTRIKSQKLREIFSDATRDEWKYRYFRIY